MFLGPAKSLDTCEMVPSATVLEHQTHSAPAQVLRPQQGCQRLGKFFPFHPAAMRDSLQTLAGLTAKIDTSGKGKVQQRRW